MRKGYLGIIIILSVILVSGCGEMKSQEVTTFTGISIARRGASRITPIPVTGQSIELEGATIPTNSLEVTQSIGSETPEDNNPLGSAIEPTQIETLIPTQTPELAPINPTSTQEPTASGGQTGGCSPEANRSFESEVIQLVNQERSKEGLAPLSEQSQLTQAARLHSEDMACNQFFSHISSEYGDVATRVAAQGYQYSAIGENIAGGYNSPKSVVQSWMDSTGHRANIMNGTFTQIGVGYAYLDGSNLGVYWTLIVGTP